MFHNLFKGMSSALAMVLLGRYRKLSLQLLKIEAAKAYLHGVQMARLSACGLVALGLTITLIGLGGLLLHIGLFLLLPWTLEAKAVFGMALGGVYLLLGGFALRAALKEARWMEKSGASKLLNDVANGRGAPHRQG